MYTFQGKTITGHLLQLAQEGNKDFTAMLNPGVERVLGIRMPHLRHLARQIAADESWRKYVITADTDFMESRMLHGMVIAYVKGIDISERLKLVKEWVPRINSWSVCDSVCCSFKPYSAERQHWWRFIQPYFKSDREYELRFALVMALDVFVDADHVAEILQITNSIHHDGYYVKMATAWLWAECFVKFPETTMPYLSHNNLDNFTHNKAIQKICESFRATGNQKLAVRMLKRKGNQK